MYQKFKLFIIALTFALPVHVHADEPPPNCGLCPICQKARKALESEGKVVSFRDVRAEPLSEAELEELITEFGDRLVDRTTNDYRALND